MKPTHLLVVAMGCALLFFFLIAAAAPQPAFAQQQPITSEKQAAAEDLFQRGKARMAEKDFAKACALFTESYRIDAAGGTLQNLAVCYEELGKWASAYARFQELRALSKAADPPRLDRVKIADEHIEKLLPKLARVVIIVATEPRPAGLVVKIDGTPRDPVSWSEGIVVDPGAHTIDATATAKHPFTSRLDITRADEGSKKTVRVPTLVDAPESANQDGAGGGSGGGGGGGHHPTRTLGLVVGGAGVVVMGVGAVFGLLASAASTEGTDLCNRTTNNGRHPVNNFDPDGHCMEGSDALRAANRKKETALLDANIANVLVPIGAIAVAVGVYLIFRRGPERTTSGASFFAVRF